jgi:hypothetical protein
LQKNKVLISERQSLRKFFKSSEILAIEPLSLKFTDRKKIVVFTPSEYTDGLANAMFKAGAGVIGNYNMCSFRVEGTGTYKPAAKAKPYEGKKRKLSRVSEIKLEIECGKGILNNVIDAMLEAHPYEEVAYEVYDFTKRENVSDGSVITLKKVMKYSKLMLRLNKKMSSAETSFSYKGKSFKKIVLIERIENEDNIKKSRLQKADAVLFIDKKVNLIIL